jgi:hypothetical protein
MSCAKRWRLTENLSLLVFDIGRRAIAGRVRLGGSDVPHRLLILRRAFLSNDRLIGAFRRPIGKACRKIPSFA